MEPLMIQSMKMSAGSALPAMAWPIVGGAEINPVEQSGWRLVSVYRGKHCPLCKKYFKAHDGMLDDFTLVGVSVVAVSAGCLRRLRLGHARRVMQSVRSDA